MELDLVAVHNKLARRLTPSTNDEGGWLLGASRVVACRAAFRRCRSATSQRRRVSSTRLVSDSSSSVGGYDEPDAVGWSVSELAESSTMSAYSLSSTARSLPFRRLSG